MLLQIPINESKTIQELAEAALKQVLDDTTVDGVTIREWLEKISSGEYQPVKHGRWIATNDENKKRCSKCDIIHLIAQYPYGKANYCPNCGAKMNGEKNGFDDENWASGIGQTFSP